MTQATICYSQWHQLPDLDQPTKYSAFPVADGKLFAGINHMPNPPTSSSPPYTDFGHSHDDLNSFFHHTNLSVTFASALVSAGSSVNDTTACFRYDSRVYFTFDGFVGIKQVGPVLNNPGASIRNGSNYMTSKFSYCTQFAYYAIPPALRDTMILIRENPASVKVLTKIPTYSDPNKKLLFVNDSVGYLIVNAINNPAKSSLIKTVNYGQSWNGCMVDSINQINDFSFASNSTGYIMKADGSIHKTTNGGATWSQISVLSPSLNCIQFSNDTLGFIGANNGLLWKTTNGGISWQNEISSTTENISRLYTFGNVAYFITHTNRVFKNSINIVGLNELQVGLKELNIYPNPVSDQITIALDGQNAQIKNVRLINVLGEVVYQKNCVNLNSTQVSVNELLIGTYVISVQTENGVLRKKIVVSR